MKKFKGRIYLVTPEKDLYRHLRLKEELKKEQIDFREIISDKCLINDKGVFYKGKSIKPRKEDKVWFCGNSMIHHYLIHEFEKTGCFVWPSSESIKFCDKFLTASFFNDLKIKTPKTALILTYDQKSINRVVKYTGGFPCVVKNVKGTQGLSVELVNNMKELTDFIYAYRKKNLKTSRTPNKKFFFLVQEYIKNDEICDYRVLSLKGEIIGGIKRTAGTGFKANLSQGGRGEIFKIDKDLEKKVKRMIHRKDLFFVGIDFMKNKEGYYGIELNTSAGFEGFEEITGQNIANIIIKELINAK